MNFSDRLQRLEDRAGEHDTDAAIERERADLFARWLALDVAHVRLAEAAAMETGDGRATVILRSDSEDCCRCRMSFADWMGANKIEFPGVRPMRIRNAPWSGSLVFNGNVFLQIFAEMKIGGTPQTAGEPAGK